MRIRVLGAVELVDAGGNVCPIGSANQRTVLAVLLAHRGEVVSIDALIDALWGEAPPASAVSTLRTYVSRLRSHLGSALASRGGGFAFDVPPDDVDARRFEALVDAARGAGAAEAVELLAGALRLWKGRRSEIVPTSTAFVPRPAVWKNDIRRHVRHMPQRCSPPGESMRRSPLQSP